MIEILTDKLKYLIDVEAQLELQELPTSEKFILIKNQRIAIASAISTINWAIKEGKQKGVL